MGELEDLMEKYPGKKAVRDTNKNQFSNRWQLHAGRSTQALGAKSFEHPHNCKKGKGVFLGTKSLSEDHQEAIRDKAKELLVHVCPDFQCEGDYVTNFSCMIGDDPSMYVKTHVDEADVSWQIGFSMGKDCTGGHITLWNPDGTTQTVDYTNRPVKMDGRLPHRISPIRARALTPEGKRFCVIFFKLFDRRIIKPLPPLHPAKFIPSDKQALFDIPKECRATDAAIKAWHEGKSLEDIQKVQADSSKEESTLSGQIPGKTKAGKKKGNKGKVCAGHTPEAVQVKAKLAEAGVERKQNFLPPVLLESVVAFIQDMETHKRPYLAKGFSLFGVV
jgi:hypothetical protein